MPDYFIPPDVGIFEDPAIQFCINPEWWAHISAQILPLADREAWHGTSEQIEGAVDSIFKLLKVVEPTGDCGGAVTVDYPRHWTGWHDEATILTGGALVRGSLADSPYFVSNSWYNTITYQATAANGDSFTQSFLADAGDYVFRTLGAHNAVHGKVDWYLDDEITPFTTQDWYASSVQANQLKSASVSIAAAGRHTLKGIVNGRNASNTVAYALPLTKYWLEYVP